MLTPVETKRVAPFSILAMLVMLMGGAIVQSARIAEGAAVDCHNDYWLFNRLSEGKAFKSIDGGRTINGPIEYALNTTVKWYSDTEALDTTRVDVFDEFSYAWKEIGGTALMSDLERARNQGSGQKFDLEPAKLDNLRNSMRKILNDAFFSDGTGTAGKEAGGLQYLIAATPTSGTVGGISRSTYSFWRNIQASGASSSTAFDNLRAQMKSVYNQCSSGVGSGHPEWEITDRATFEGYEGILTANETVVSKERGQANAGFKNEFLGFKDTFLGYDRACPAGSMFFCNSSNLKLAYLKGYWMKGQVPIRPANQTLDVFVVSTKCNLYSNNPRRLGVLTSCS